MSKGQLGEKFRWVAAAVVIGAVGWIGCDQWEGVQLEQSNLVSPNGAITQGADEARTNWYPDQPGLDPAIVAGPNFKRLFKTALPLSAGEKVLAQPLVTNGKVFIATEQNNLYLLDGISGAITAKRALGAGYDASTNLGCGDITPAVGITGTPVIDNSTNTAYLVSKASSGTQTMHAIDLTSASLADKAGFPVTLTGAAQNQTTVSFDPVHNHQRPGLLLMNGVVYAAFSSHCDDRPYHGFIFGVSTAGAIKARYTDDSGEGAGIWMSGAGLASDGAGQILFATGNGYAANTYPGPVASNAPPATLEEAVVRTVVQADGSLKATDFFAPNNAKSLGDNDVSSGGITVLPSQFGTTTFPRTAVLVGKEGYFYTFNRDKLGGFQQAAASSNAGDDVLGKVLLAATWGHPAVWPGDGGYVFVTTNGGPTANGYRLDVLKYGTNGTKPQFTAVGNALAPDGTIENFGSYSGSPIVTSNGTNAGSALVWCVGNSAALRVYKLNGSNLTRIFTDSTGSTAKFQTVGVGAGRVYVGTGDGNVIGYGAGTATVTGATVDFGTVTVGQQKQLTATITANQAVTIPAGGLTFSPSIYTLGTPAPTLPANLAAGGTLSVPVIFKPTASGTLAGSLNVAISGGGGGAISLIGTGQVIAAQLTAAPTSLAFGAIPTNTTKALSVQLTNTGNQTLTFAGSTAPAAPFSVTGVPASGATLVAGASTTVTVTFAPTTATTFTGSVVFNSNGGNVTVPLAGSSGSAPVMVITPVSTDYGSIAAGTSLTKTFTIKNTGGTDLTIVKSKPPALGPFVATTTLGEGSVVTAGQTLTESVKFSSTTAGSYSDIWVITGNDTGQPVNVAFSGTVTGTTTALSRTGWVASASATGGTDVPANALDGSQATRWSSGAVMAAGMYFQVDMGAAQTVSQVVMDSANGDYARAFSVYVTNDLANLGTAVATTTAAGTPVSASFTAKSGRYIRVVLGTVPAGTTSWWSIQEFNAFGAGGGGTGAGGAGGAGGTGGAGGAGGSTGGATGASQINAGGPAVAPYVADVDFTGGTTINHANTIDVSGVTNPAPSAVYQTGRTGTFSYTIPGFTASSSHTVRLHMCETYFGTAASRLFNVTINGNQVLTGFDIFAAAGAKNKAIVQQFNANANANGQFVLQFTPTKDNALVSGIEIQ